MTGGSHHTISKGPQSSILCRPQVSISPSGWVLYVTFFHTGIVGEEAPLVPLVPGVWSAHIGQLGDKRVLETCIVPQDMTMSLPEPWSTVAPQWGAFPSPPPGPGLSWDIHLQKKSSSSKAASEKERQEVTVAVLNFFFKPPGAPGSSAPPPPTPCFSRNREIGSTWPS